EAQNLAPQVIGLEHGLPTNAVGGEMDHAREVAALHRAQGYVPKTGCGKGPQMHISRVKRRVVLALNCDAAAPRSSRQEESRCRASTCRPPRPRRHRPTC